MKLYLSSYKIGNTPEQYKELLREGAKKIGYICNAFDFSTVVMERAHRHQEIDRNQVRDLGLEVEDIDLRNYFHKTEELRSKLNELDGLWVSGGNVFVLRQAMKLSGLDELLHVMPDDFVYGGYSAGVCVLSPTLEGYAIVDDAKETPYADLDETIMEGLGLIDYTLLPHYQSAHEESALIDEERTYCVNKGLAFKTLRDGEVIVIA